MYSHVKSGRGGGGIGALCAVSCTRLFACVNWTKSQISIKHEMTRSASMRPLAFSCTSKRRSNKIPAVN